MPPMVATTQWAKQALSTSTICSTSKQFKHSKAYKQPINQQKYLPACTTILMRKYYNVTLGHHY